MDIKKIAADEAKLHVSARLCNSLVMGGCINLIAGVAQIDYEGDSDKSNVKQSLITSYNRVLAPKVKACISAAVARDATETGNYHHCP